jgi:hypothetical protein
MELGIVNEVGWLSVLLCYTLYLMQFGFWTCTCHQACRTMPLLCLWFSHPVPILILNHNLCMTVHLYFLCFSSGSPTFWACRSQWSLVKMTLSAKSSHFLGLYCMPSSLAICRMLHSMYVNSLLRSNYMLACLLRSCNGEWRSSPNSSVWPDTIWPPLYHKCAPLWQMPPSLRMCLHICTLCAW